MKNILLVAFVLLLMFIPVTACMGAILTDNLVEADFMESAKSILPPLETMAAFEIIGREADADAKIENIWCRVESHDDEAAYVRFYELEYQLVDSGWILKSSAPYRTNDWVKAPITGVGDDVIADALGEDMIESCLGRSFAIDGEEWYLRDISLGDVQIVGRDTQLENLSDKVTVSVEILHDVMMAQGQIQLVYKYDDRWLLDNTAVTTHFTGSYRPGLAHVLTAEEATSAIVRAAHGNPLIFGDRNDNDRRSQVLGVSDGEIVGLSIESQVSSQVNTVQTYEAAFVLSKTLVDFDVNTTLVYKYDNVGGWGVDGVTFGEARVNSVNRENFIGDWEGYYDINTGIASSGNHKIMFLDILALESDGTLTATFSEHSATPFSTDMTGFFDFGRLSFDMNNQAESVVSGTALTGFSGYLIVDAATLEQSARYKSSLKRGYYMFSVSKNED